MENILDMTEEELEAELLRQLEEMPSSDEEPEEQQQQIDTLAVSRGKLLSAPDENTPQKGSPVSQDRACFFCTHSTLGQAMGRP